MDCHPEFCSPLEQQQTLMVKGDEDLLPGSADVACRW